ncbi:PRTRC system ThiF family protein [Dyadobacter sp. CY312]|uniref:PRTRC system ThiF family protein n=1 Tax=Dyadobacter sp. CY312 TaxID=2907303 RepID=UPI001F4083B9|nr:PRTRC system ThiF family protein [Dyadobacter sp. CY312]MCE7044435.1 PRTRC system ThiF family protein [Dyadobacter sp. CY312]
MNTPIIKPVMHFAPAYLLSPTNPITVNLIGAGGTGSRVLTALAEMNHSLNALGHAGLYVRMFDDDVITHANLGRQRFAVSELGLKKTVARINNINRFFGTNWKSVPYQFSQENLQRFNSFVCANIFISCVDSVSARMQIAELLKSLADSSTQHRDRPFYWMDYGNSKSTGQVILSTIGDILQPASKKFKTIKNLPFVTDEFGSLLQSSETADNTPSCSLPEALEKQDLFINATITQLGSALLWSLLRQGMTENRGIFVNLETLITQPLKVAETFSNARVGSGRYFSLLAQEK